MAHTQQRTLGQKVTAREVVAQAMAYLAKQTAPLGNGALAVVMGSTVAVEGLKRLDEAAITGDVTKTRAVAREVVKEILAQIEEINHGRDID